MFGRGCFDRLRIKVGGRRDEVEFGALRVSKI